MQFFEFYITACGKKVPSSAMQYNTAQHLHYNILQCNLVYCNAKYTAGCCLLPDV